jgi:hypothetical protein
MVRNWRSLLRMMSDDIKFAVVIVVHNDKQALCYKLHDSLVILLVISLYSHSILLQPVPKASALPQ